MQSVAFSVPLLPGKTETELSALESCSHGERRTAHQASRERHGISREAVFIQHTPDGDVEVIYLEADDLQAAFAGIASSQEPFDRWFREHVLDVNGMDLEQGFPPPQQLLDYWSGTAS